MAVDENGVPEEIAVNVCRVDCDPKYDKQGLTVGMGSAACGVPVMGRSWHDGHKDTRENASQYGFLFEEQIQTALREDPPVAFLCQWNEWLVPFLTKQTNTLYSMGDHPIHLQDEFNEEYSRDIEPMKGGYKDAYYLQMVSFIRRFKGLEAPALATRMYAIDPNGDFGQWAEVQPTYLEMTGDIAPRSFRGYDGVGRYENHTGRNEFQTLKVAVDREKVYFYVACTAPITAPSKENWMSLYLKCSEETKPNWEGYQFAINRIAPDGQSTLVERANRDGEYS